MLPSWRLVCLGLFCASCGGTEPAPQAAAAPPPTPPPAAAPASAPATAPAAANSGTDDAWDGEAEATGKAKPGASETRTSEVIGQVVRDNRKPFRECYEKGRKELPDLAGTLTLHFVLDPKGKVKKVELNNERSTIHAPSVVNCATAAFTALKFPPSSRGMESEGNYPFDFKP